MKKAEHTMADNPPVNIPDVLNRAMGDIELIQMLFEELQSTIGAHEEKIDAALSYNDLGALTREAHQLKGAAGSMGVTAVAAKARDLELMGNGNVEIDLQVFTDLQNEIQRFLDFMDHVDWTQV